MSCADEAPLAPREAYAEWAQSYGAENALTVLEQMAVQAASLSGPMGRLLDVGCGIGRRIVERDPQRTVGLDLTRAMLAVARQSGPHLRLVQGDLLQLPVADRAFDVVWCRLVLGHVADLESAYRELSRVSRDGASLLVSDFHPAAAAAGHRRTFRDRTGKFRTVIHHPHSLADHRDAAQAAGFQSEAFEERCVGPAVREFYEASGKRAAYEEQLGLPLVFAWRFSRRSR